MRAVSSEGFGRMKNHMQLRDLLAHEPEVADFWAGKSAKIPEFYVDWVRRDLGPLWQWLPEGAMYHEPLAYLTAESHEIEEPLIQLAAAPAT